MNPKEAEKALIESCIAEQLSDTVWICILFKKRPLPDLGAWQAALDRLTCGVKLPQRIQHRARHNRGTTCKLRWKGVFVSNRIRPIEGVLENLPAGFRSR